MWLGLVEENQYILILIFLQVYFERSHAYIHNSFTEVNR